MRVEALWGVVGNIWEVNKKCFSLIVSSFIVKGWTIFPVKSFKLNVRTENLLHPVKKKTFFLFYNFFLSILFCSWYKSASVPVFILVSRFILYFTSCIIKHQNEVNHIIILIFYFCTLWLVVTVVTKRPADQFDCVLISSRLNCSSVQRKIEG